MPKVKRTDVFEDIRRAIMDPDSGQRWADGKLAIQVLAAACDYVNARHEDRATRLKAMAELFGASAAFGKDLARREGWSEPQKTDAAPTPALS